jgi:predicted TIM-barrel fold metal-dependent hydrolase
MWESDYPHTASTYPESWKIIEETLQDVSAEEKRKILYANAQRVYHLE